MLLTDNSLRFLDRLLSLGEDELDVAGVGHVGIDLQRILASQITWSQAEDSITYTTVSTVCAAALLGGLVDLDVLDDQVTGVETLSIGVGLGVLKETEEELGRLNGPAGAGDTELLAY